MPEKNPFESKIGLSKDPKPNRKVDDSEGEKEEKGITRRTLLKAGVAAGALALGGKYLLDGEKDMQEELSEEQSQQQGGATQEQEMISRQDEQIAGETIENQLKQGQEITLDRGTKQAIYDKWLESYSSGGENYPGLETAMRRMKPWEEKMKEEFRQEGVPESYVYLAIPESHFDLEARSRKAAAGPFQFTRSTGKMYGLRQVEGYDERNDPILSAKACARHLKDSYERFNSDWDLALADYNGAYTNEYAKFRKNRSERNYDDYLAWREARLNEFVARSHYEHEITKKDKNLGNVAKKYGVSVEELKKFNKMSSDLIIVGKILKLPPTIPVKMRMLRDSLENLNYPEKFYAVLKVIEKEKISEKIAMEELEFETVEVKETKKAVFEEEIRKGEGLFAVARKIRAKAKKQDPKFDRSVLNIQGLIQRQNKIKDPRKVYPGQVVTASLEMGRPASLKQIAKQHRHNIDLLKKFNPAITRSAAGLPSGAKIRIPKK